jgi:hypothetical protein
MLAITVSTKYDDILDILQNGISSQIKMITKQTM